MSVLPQLLICDDDALFHLSVKQALKGKCNCRSAYHGDEALVILKSQKIDIVLLDVQIRSADEGLQYIPKLKELDSEMTIIMASSVTDFKVVREAMRLGATDYLIKSANSDELTHALLRILDTKILQIRQQQQTFEVLTTQKKQPIIGESNQIKCLRKTLERLQQNTSNVLITGETGTGKEVVARQLRRSLPDGSLVPFIAIDSSTIQSSTAESLLFGHEKGAFTGAEKSTKGVFEEADGGIVYFDEIANMPLEIQAKLLRVLQEKEITRLGSTRSTQLEFQVICASNKDLEAMAEAGEFKYDLLQRLNVIPLVLTPLRERPEDIKPLLEHLVKQHAPTGKTLSFSTEIMNVLMDYSWPGNVRELSNLVAYLLVMADSPEIRLSDLPPKIQNKIKRQNEKTIQIENTQERNFYKRVFAFEKKILSEEYENSGGNVTRLATTLEMDRSHLYKKLQEHGLKTSSKETNDRKTDR